jgi:hypothetical protein
LEKQKSKENGHQSRGQPALSERDESKGKPAGSTPGLTTCETWIVDRQP